MNCHIGWIAHAGLGAERPGGAPSHTTLDRALAHGADRIECDVRLTRDGVLVVRHDATVDRRVRVDELTLAELRRSDPEILTVDEVAEHVTGEAILMLDLKDDRALPGLARWLTRRRLHSRCAVTGENLIALEELRRRLRRVELWPSFPDLGASRCQHLWKLANAVAAHLRPRAAASAVGHLRRQLTRLPEVGDLAGWARLCGLLWWADAPRLIVDAAARVGARGVCVHHWTVTPEVVETAHRQGLELATWTVNRPGDLAYVLDCGADMVTSDRLVELRPMVARLSGRPQRPATGRHRAAPCRTPTGGLVADPVLASSS